MPSISVFKRKRKGKADKIYSAQIRFGEREGGASYLRSTGVTDRREAEAAARRIAREIAEKELPRRGQEILTLETMFSRWIDERASELRSGKDIKWQIELLLRLIGGAKVVAEIGNKDINNFIQDAKAGGTGPSSINRCLGRMRATMNYAAEMWEEPIRLISWRKMMQEEGSIREVYLSPEEARRLMELLPSHIALAFAFTIYTGVRLGELKTLTWGRVDLARGAVVVVTKGKGAKLTTRTVWLSQKAVQVLATIGAEAREDGSPVFDLSRRRTSWARARAAIGRPDVTWHDLRGMTATWSRQYAGADMRLIQRTLGHSHSKVTERYARVIDREIATMLDKLPDISPQAGKQKQLSK